MTGQKKGRIVEDAVFRRSAELLEADINDELVALEPNQGFCFGFNSVAKDVWRKLEQPRSFKELRAGLIDDYDVSEEQCTQELRDLLEQLSQAKLIERV